MRLEKFSPSNLLRPFQPIKLIDLFINSTYPSFLILINQLVYQPVCKVMRRPNSTVNPLRHCVIPGPRFSPRHLELSLPSLQSTQQINTSSRSYSSKLLSHRSQIQPHQQIQINNNSRRHRTLITTPTMASDDAYMSFLNKANADLGAGRSQANNQSDPTVRTGTVDVNAQIPAPLSSIDAYYVSETDEPFEPVVLKWEDAKRGIWPGFCISPFSLLISLPFYPIIVPFSSTLHQDPS